MKIRVISDLHLDINKKYPLELENKDIFTIVAGDISANQTEAREWIDKNIHNGVLVEGNHIGYDSDDSIQKLELDMEKYYSADKNVTYLNNNYKMIGDYVFVGGIMWTDYNLEGEAFATMQKMRAVNYMNDFRYNRYNILNKNFENETYDLIRRLNPNNCADMFFKTKNVIKSVSEMFKDKKIIVVTHHAPSAKSIGEEYRESDVNGSYASNLEKFIIDHPNIVCWCHGHIHSNSDYMIGNCRVICNPRGYEYYHENKNFDSSMSIEI